MLKKSCTFTLEVIELYNELLLNGKKPIAERILSSAINGITNLHKILQETKGRAFKEATSKAIVNFKNVIYWIEQCVKSGYWFDEKLLKDAFEILEFCQDEELVY
jgi:hypothetical protein